MSRWAWQRPRWVVTLYGGLRYLNRPSFWALTFVGWLVTACVLGLAVRAFASVDDLSRAEHWITGIGIHALSLLAGFSFARQKSRGTAAPGEGG